MCNKSSGDPLQDSPKPNIARKTKQSKNFTIIYDNIIVFNWIIGLNVLTIKKIGYGNHLGFAKGMVLKWGGFLIKGAHPSIFKRIKGTKASEK